MANFDRTADSVGNYPHLPVPAGAVAGDWERLSVYIEDAFRCLTWSRHDAGGALVAVEGAQFGDGRVERFIGVRPDDGADLDLTTVFARRLAAALLDASDILDGLR